MKCYDTEMPFVGLVVLHIYENRHLFFIFTAPAPLEVRLQWIRLPLCRNK